MNKFGISMLALSLSANVAYSEVFRVETFSNNNVCVSLYPRSDCPMMTYLRTTYVGSGSVKIVSVTFNNRMDEKCHWEGAGEKTFQMGDFTEAPITNLLGTFFCGSLINLKIKYINGDVPANSTPVVYSVEYNF